MRTRFAALAASLWLLPAAGASASDTGHSVDRPQADSVTNGIAIHTPVAGVQVDTSRTQHASPPPHRLSRVPAPDHGGAPPPLWTRDSTPAPSGHWRVGLHASAHDIGLLLGASAGGRSVSVGLDGWVRPGVFTKEVRTTPTRRAQYKEILWGFDPWIQAQFGSNLRLAVVAALDLVVGTWYGTDKSPDPDLQPALGVKLLFPEIFQIGIRGTYGEGLLGRWRGEAVCEF